MTANIIERNNDESSLDYLNRLESEGGINIDVELQRRGFPPRHNLNLSACEEAAHGFAEDHREAAEVHAATDHGFHLQRLHRQGVDVDGMLQRSGFPPARDLSRGAQGEAVARLLAETSEQAAIAANRR